MNIYDILLNTPLGQKKGELSAEIRNGRLSGFLSLLGHTEPIEGTVEENGQCSLSGKFITLLSTFNFTADGIINSDFLNLKIRSGSRVYEMKGVPHCAEGSGRQ